MPRCLAAVLSVALVTGPAAAAGAAPRPADTAHTGHAAAAGVGSGADHHPGAVAPSAGNVSGAGSLPLVSGSFGQTPSVSWPSSKPPSSLVSKVLRPGHGATVKSGDLIAVNYTGWIWRGKVFDSSFLAKFGHQSPLATAIGVHAVVSGWDDGLPGTRVGSRVLLVIPPKWGYGSAGSPSAGITGKDTIVFVVDVVGAWGKNASAATGAKVLATSHAGITVTGALASPPIVRLSASTAKPTKQTVTVLARGRGPKVTGGLVVYEEYVVDWTGKVVASTWQQGRPTDSTVGGSSANDPFSGMPLGSRLLFEEPKSTQGGPYAVVVDLVADLTGR